MTDKPEMTEAERVAYIAAYLNKINDFASGKTHACRECGAEVTSAIIYEKSEPELFSLYVEPCNHRLGLWSKVPEWITDVEVVPLDMEFDEDDDAGVEITACAPDGTTADFIADEHEEREA